MDYTITTYSNRMYDLPFYIKCLIDDTSFKFNRELYSSYNRAFLKEYNTSEFEAKYNDKSLHMICKDNTGFNDYYANSVTRLAVGKVKSQKELTKSYIEDKEETLKAIDKKLKEKKEYLSCITKDFK